jgi:mRNA-degrading endonuclease RelE of RelBE toxin-antitoxin system
MSSWTGKGAATRIYSPDFDKDFSELPQPIQRQIEKKLDEMGLRLGDYPHYRLTGSPECRFRVGDHRVIYEFDAQKNAIYVLAVGRRDKIYKRR